MKRHFYENPWFWIACILALLYLFFWPRWKRQMQGSSSSSSSGTTPNTPAPSSPSPTAPPGPVATPDYMPVDTSVSVDATINASAPAAATAPTVNGNGSSLTMAGFAYGDVSATSLLRLAPESIAYLDEVNWIDPADGSDSGWPLYQAWLNGYNMTGGNMGDPNMVAATAQIQARILAKPHG
jgi:hypothetical protein